MKQDMLRNFDCHGELANFGKRFSFWLYRTRVSGDGNEILEAIKPTVLEVETVADRWAPSDPTLVLDHSVAQSIMNQMWRLGLRPHNGEGADAQVTAIKAHLEDMRTLVFKGSGR